MIQVNKLLSQNMVGRWLRLEGLAIFGASLYLFGLLNVSWVVFVVMFLVPDLAMMGYLVDKKVGSYSYNLWHTYTTALVVVVGGMVLGNQAAQALGLILFGHIGLDRALGYGLKYPAGYKDTHMQKV